MDMPVNVPVDDPNADTEWNDILRKHGIIPEKPPSPTPMIEEALVEARRLAHENRLEGKGLDELAELEDDEDEDFLEQYRKKRMGELATISSSSIYNQVYHLQKPDYARDVTEASNKSYVLVLLTSSQGSNIESRLMMELWRDLATRFGDVKFCQMRADLCIEGYPDKNTPTILVYRNGDIQRQIVTLRELQGSRTTATDLEKLLLDMGAISHSDSRIRDRSAGTVEAKVSSSKIRQGRDGRAALDSENEGSDWD